MAARPFVTVVSGLPRSGTSLMMRMLESGGIPPVTDRIRAADEDNPKGYYEFERVKALDKGDTAWVPEARGRAVKVISALLRHLPPTEEYRVLFMRRRIEEVLASQKEMLKRRGERTDLATDAELAELFQRHVRHVEGWAAAQPHAAWLTVDYNALVADPGPIVERIDRFLGGGLDTAAMLGAIDRSLYRQRAKTP